MNKGTIAGQLWRTLQHALDLLFPPSCVVCQRSGCTLCLSCMAHFRLATGSRCLHCHNQLSPHGICISCQYHRLQLSGLRAAYPYEEPLRSCIHALKYEGQTRLAEPLGALLAQAYSTYGMQADMLIPVPLHSERQRQRGYNQSHLLAQACARQLGMTLNHTTVTRIRPTLAQAQLGARERQQNVAGAFLCAPGITTNALHGRKIVIIDDVCTTGATLEACAAPLFAAGACSVWGLVLARPLHS